jgi:BlaI family transcriptional regulator, penicillinase repressor
MPRRRSPALTEGELRIMRVLWARGRGTVGDVVDELPPPKPAYNTVLTMLRILERKGHVTHDKAGRAFTYTPLVDPGQARRRAVSHLLKHFFDDSPEMLILDLLGHDRVDLADLRRIRELIATAPGNQPKKSKGRAAR